jgi:hypothetical protein
MNLASFAEQEYVTRLLRVRATGGALLLASVTHIVLTAALISGVMRVVPYLGATLCVLPLTCYLARLYTISVAGACEARTQLTQSRSLRRLRSHPS